MPHAHTASVIDAWRRLRRPGRPLPARTALVPGLLGALTPQLFVLAEEDGAWRVRTAGALLDDLHGRPLAGADFTALWAEPDRPAVRLALEDARRRRAPRILSARGETARGRGVLLEVMLAPATGPTDRPDRCLGLYQPLTPLARLDGGALTSLRLADPAAATGPRLVVDNTRPRPLG